VLNPDQYNRILNLSPLLANAASQFQREFQRAAFYVRIPAGKDVFIEGDRAEAIALLISGSVRVYKVGETGREITLYRFGAGESCILTVNAILSQQTFPAIATVIEDTEAVMIPAEVFRDWVGRSDLWRTFVFDLLSQRLTSVLAILDEVAFQRMDRRIAALLLKRSQFGNPIQVTHQQIAAELGSSREVISRILEGFASEGMLRVTRGQVDILDLESLNHRSIL